MSLLRVDRITVAYDTLRVLRNISLEVGREKVIVLIGLNGAGKTTTLKTIMGVTKPISGKIFFNDRDVTHLPPHKRVEDGISLVPEGRLLFHTLTARENLLLGAYVRGDGVQERMRGVFQLFPILLERQDQHAGTLSGGEQQMLAIGRGLMSDPKLLMLDEPSLGLAPAIVEKLYAAVAQIRSQGVSVLLVEQHVALALRVADYAYAMEMGEVTFHDTGERLLTDERVRRAYLG